MQRIIPEVEFNNIHIENVVRKRNQVTKILVLSNQRGLDIIDVFFGNENERLDKIKNALDNEDIQVVDGDDDLIFQVIQAVGVPELEPNLIDINQSNPSSPIVIRLEKKLSIDIIESIKMNADIASQLLQIEIVVEVKP